MLWWFVILGVSTAVVVSVVLSFYVRVRRHMKQTPDQAAESEGNGQRTLPGT